MQICLLCFDKAHRKNKRQKTRKRKTKTENRTVFDQHEYLMQPQKKAHKNWAKENPFQRTRTDSN